MSEGEETGRSASGIMANKPENIEPREDENRQTGSKTGVCLERGGGAERNSAPSPPSSASCSIPPLSFFFSRQHREEQTGLCF